MAGYLDSVSVIIPTWNRAATLKRAIASALNQTFPPLEILVCDDGSTDNSEQIVKEIKSERVRWLTGTRGGCPAIPRNRGLQESKGTWIAFLDSDDEWTPEKLQTQFELVQTRNCKAVCSNAIRYVPGKGQVGNLIDWRQNRIDFTELLQDNKVVCSSVMIHREILNVTGGFPESHELKVGEDYALWLRVASITDFCFAEAPLVIYRDDPMQSVRAESPGHWVQKKRVLGNFIKWAARVYKVKVSIYVLTIVWITIKQLLNKVVRKCLYRLALMKNVVQRRISP